MSDDDIRGELRKAEADLRAVRVSIDEAYELNGGHIPRDRAEVYMEQLETLTTTIWALRAKLRHR